MYTYPTIRTVYITHTTSINVVLVVGCTEHGDTSWSCYHLPTQLPSDHQSQD